MTTTESIGEFDLKFHLVRRFQPLPSDLRLSYLVPLLCLIVRAAYGRRCNISHIHVLVWALQSEHHASMLHAPLTFSEHTNLPVIRSDPATEFAIDVCIGEGLLAADSPKSPPSAAPTELRLKITDAGLALANMTTEVQAFEWERLTLDLARRHITKAYIQALFGG